MERERERDRECKKGMRERGIERVREGWRERIREGWRERGIKRVREGWRERERDRESKRGMERESSPVSVLEANSLQNTNYTHSTAGPPHKR